VDRGLSIGFGASGREYFVGAGPGAADDRIRSLVDGDEVLAQRNIHLLAFSAQAFVGLLPL
jgi:hypothetical protein